MKASVAQLAQLPGVWRGGELEHVSHPVVATGHEALDRELPGGGWPTGTLSEVLHDAAGIGEVTFLSGAIARASGEDSMTVLGVNRPRQPRPRGSFPCESFCRIRPSSPLMTSSVSLFFASSRARVMASDWRSWSESAREVRSV